MLLLCYFTMTNEQHGDKVNFTHKYAILQDPPKREKPNTLRSQKYYLY